jgi:broad specificity phosphatase PhoE
MRYLCLIRHADAMKNADKRFSGLSGQCDETLTSLGISQVGVLASDLTALARELSISSLVLFSAESQRSKLTAEILAQGLGFPSQNFGGLDSIDSGPFSGLTEGEVNEANPEFTSALRAYRSGLMSSYDIPRPASAETLPDFEARIEVGLERLREAQEEFVAVVAHRSPITAMLLNIVRTNHGYPQDFYGYVELTTGHYTVYDFEQNRFICIDQLRQSI